MTMEILKQKDHNNLYMVLTLFLIKGRYEYMKFVDIEFVKTINGRI